VNEYGTTFTLTPSVEGERRKSRQERVRELEEHDDRVASARGHVEALRREQMALSQKLERLERHADLVLVESAPSSISEWVGARQVLAGTVGDTLIPPVMRDLAEVEQTIARAEEELQRLERNPARTPA
jgi:phage shock protein A